MQPSHVHALATLFLLAFCGACHSEDAGEATRTSASFGTFLGSSGGYEEICRTLQHAAMDNGLPVDFFAKLIWQESRFDPAARSRVGAQGIAQFMPTTAFSRGLLNPFNPVEAIRESASYLRELKRTFGNLGLAAAAYNAGPGRLRRWLSGRISLPQETLRYVQIVTGKPIAEWSSGLSSKWDGITMPKDVPCYTLADIVSGPGLSENHSLTPPNWAAWGVQLLGNWAQGQVLASYERLRRRYFNILGDKDPLVVVAYGPSGRSKRFLVRVAEDTREGAERFCSKLRHEKVSCLTIRNPTQQEIAAKAERYAHLMSYAQGHPVRRRPHAGAP